VVKLEEYLLGLREQGTDLGDGQFSLNPESAKGRLAHFKLIREMGWASLLVQAAVLWNCPNFQVVQTRYLTRFLIPLATLDLPTEEELLQGLSRIDLASETGLDKFLTAVQILLHQGRLPFQVKICRSGQVETLAYGELTWFDQLRRHPDNALLVDINHCKPLNESLYPAFLAKKEQMAIRNELEIYGAPSPIPIIFDGREMAGRFGPPEPDDSGQRVLLALQLLAQPTSRLKDLRVPHALRKAAESESNSLLVATRIQGFASLSLRLPAKTEDEHEPPLIGRCHLAWVQAGVVIERFPLPFDSRVLCLDLYLSGEGLETDLSGSQLIRSDALEQRQQTALREFHQALQTYKEQIPTDAELSQTETRDHKDNHPVIGTALFLTVFAPMMAVGTLLSLFLFPHVGIPVLGAGWLGYKHQPFKVDDEELLKRCRLWLTTDLERFLELSVD
jgi:hypothetical protein